jgi:hypothetical protein
MAKITLSIRLEQDAIDALDALRTNVPNGQIGRSRLIEAIVAHFLTQDFLEQKRLMPRVPRKPRGGGLDND